MISEKAQARLWAKVRLPSTAGGCLVWQGKTDGNGAPEFYADASRTNRKKVKARRYMWQLCTGEELPRSVELTPECDDPMCIRQDHMAEYGRGLNNPYRRYSYETRQGREHD